MEHSTTLHLVLELIPTSTSEKLGSVFHRLQQVMRLLYAMPKINAAGAIGNIH